MHPIVQSIEDDNFELFTQLVEQHPEYIYEKDPDGWGLLQLVISYKMPEFAEFLLERMTYEEVNQSLPEHPLYIAFYNTPDMLLPLAQHEKMDLNYHFKGQDNLFILAAMKNNEDVLNVLFEKGISPFYSNLNEQNALSISVSHNNYALFERCVNLPDFADNYNESLIKQSIRNNNVEIFKALLPYSQLSVDELFDQAADFSHLQIMDYLLEHEGLIPGQKQITQIIDVMCPRYEDPEKQEAAMRLAQFLFDINVSFDKFINSDGQSAWVLSIQNDNEYIFNKLIQSNQNINIEDDRHYTPLFYAIEKRNLAFVKSILAKHPDLTHTDRNESTALIQAVRYNQADIVAEILKHPNVLINEKNKNKESALSLAIHKKNLNIISQLLWAGAEISTNPVSYIEDNSIFQIGLSGAYEKALDLQDEIIIDNFVALAKLGLNVNQTNEQGDSFLLHFIKEGYLNNFKAFLKCRFDPNQVDSEGNSPIMCAVNKTNPEYAKGLLWKASNLDYDLVNQHGKTVYDLLENTQHGEIAKLIMRDDEHLSYSKIAKVLPNIVSFDTLEGCEEILASFDISDIKDKNGHSLLARAIQYDKFDNFNWLLRHTNVVKELENNHESLIQAISHLPEDTQNHYLDAMAQNLKNYTKQPITP